MTLLAPKTMFGRLASQVASGRSSAAASAKGERARSGGADHLRIVNFHGIGEPQRELEAGEAPYWLGRERFREVLAAIASHTDRANIRITFDDGNRSDLAIAAPLLLEHGLTATVFVLTGRIGNPGSLAIADIDELRRLGMRIGSHGTTHRDWTSLPPRDLRSELIDSKNRLEEICGHLVPEAAIPFGRYDGRVLEALRAAGYRTAYSSDAGPANAAAFLQPRLSLRADTPLRDLHRMLAGRETPLGRLRRSIGMARKRFS